MSEIHTIFGAGQVGTQLAHLLAGEGKSVRLVRRSAPGKTIPGVTWMQGDVTDTSFATKASLGATTIYNTTNPTEYHRWDGVLQPLFGSIRRAAAEAGALLVQLESLYMYGRPEEAPFDERTPINPCTDMGRLRAEQVAELRESRERGDLRATIGFASDFFGPESPNNAVFRPANLTALARGKSVYLFGNPDMPHSYSYTPDVARGLAILGTSSGACDRDWHLPVAAQLSTRDLLQRFGEHLGKAAKVKTVPAWVLNTLGAIVPLLGAVAEMSYQWDIPYLVDDRDFCRTFGVEPTDLDEAIERTIEPFVPTVAMAA